MLSIRKLKKLAESKLGWPDTTSGREPSAKYDPFTGEVYKNKTSVRFYISTWNKAWKGAANANSNR